MPAGRRRPTTHRRNGQYRGLQISRNASPPPPKTHYLSRPRPAPSRSQRTIPNADLPRVNFWGTGHIQIELGDEENAFEMHSRRRMTTGFGGRRGSPSVYLQSTPTRNTEPASIFLTRDHPSYLSPGRRFLPLQNLLRPPASWVSQIPPLFRPLAPGMDYTKTKTIHPSPLGQLRQICILPLPRSRVLLPETPSRRHNSHPNPGNRTC